MIHEKGLCKVLSAAYKGGGYSVIPVRRQVETVARSWRRNEIILNGATWAVRCLTEDLPKEAAVQIVKDVGYMPMEPVSVQKSQPNQTMLEDVADIRESQLEELRDGSSVMVKIPVIFRDRWQLYQTTTGAVYAFDTELLKLIDFKEVSPECRITPHGNMAMFLWGDEMVFLAPGRVLPGERGKDPLHSRDGLGESGGGRRSRGEPEPVQRGPGRAPSDAGGMMWKWRIRNTTSTCHISAARTGLWA